MGFSSSWQLGHPQVRLSRKFCAADSPQFDTELFNKIVDHASQYKRTGIVRYKVGNEYLETDEMKEKLMHAFLDDNSWTKEIVSKMGIPSIFIDSLDNVHVSYGSITDEETIDPETGEEIEILKYSVKK